MMITFRGRGSKIKQKVTGEFVKQLEDDIVYDLNLTLLKTNYFETLMIKIRWILPGFTIGRVD